VPSHPPAARVLLTLALISIFVLAAPSLWAQADLWEKLMKSGSKAYSDGISQKYFQGWGIAAPNPQFAKAEEQFLAALAQTQSFPPGDIRTTQTLGALASVYMEEGKYDDAESKGNQAIAIMEAAAQPNDIRFGYADALRFASATLDARTSTLLISGAFAKRSGALAINAAATLPER
jgi:hypothetical protein